MFNIPILFVFFNRKDIAMQSFERIKAIRPSTLYLAQDGARQDRGMEEKEVIKELRQSIIDSIDWDCDVHTRFIEYNLGCANGVKTAIDWMFETEQYGIILEDDCVVGDSFFKYMEDILLRFKDDMRIGMVAGTNPLKSFKSESSFIFSRFNSCWGWGTWARAWKNMDMNMSWRDTDCESVINNSGFNGEHNSKWYFQLNCIDRKHVSAWDWQWYFSLAAQNQLCVYPSVNLVSNIGNDAEATHTSFSNITLKTGELQFPLKAPCVFAPCYQFERMFSANENSLKTRLARMLPHSVKKIIKTILSI